MHNIYLYHYFVYLYWVATTALLLNACCCCSSPFASVRTVLFICCSVRSTAAVASVAAAEASFLVCYCAFPQRLYEQRCRVLSLNTGRQDFCFLSLDASGCLRLFSIFRDNPLTTFSVGKAQFTAG